MSNDALATENARHRLGQGNQSMVLSFARQAGTFSRVQLAAATGLSPATVTRVVRTLMADGYLGDAGEVRLSGGRPQIMLEYLPKSELVAVLDVHDGLIDAVLLDWTGEEHGEAVQCVITDFAADAKRILAGYVDSVGERLKAVAIGIPGVTADGNAPVRLAPSIGQPPEQVKAVLEQELGLPVVVDNDVNLMVVGEHVSGAAVDTDDVVLMHVGETGIGAALLIDGAVRQGASGFAGEIGFLPFGEPKPAETELGAFEADWALAPIRERGSAPGPVADGVPDDALRAWGRAAATLLCVLNPEVLLLSGPRLAASELEVLIAEVVRFVPGDTDIRLAEMGPHALRIGGARRAFDLYDASRDDRAARLGT